jgi:hypothetical protein
MQAARTLRKLAVETLCAAALVTALPAQAGGIKITIRLGNPERAAGILSYRSSHLDAVYALPIVAGAAAPRSALQASRHHLAPHTGAPVARILASGAVAIDDRTFVVEGMYFRLANAARLQLGTPESIAARKRLQARLDEGPLRLLRVGVEPSGIQLVSLLP